MKIRFWGTRGSIPTPGQRTVRYGGNTACVEVRGSGDELVILDAGTGLRELGLKLAQNGGEALGLDLLISHLHWDHIQGIPFFRPAYDARNELRILGPQQQQHPLKELLGVGMVDPFFPVDLDAMPARLDINEFPEGETRRVGPFDVRSVRVYHPAPALAYRLEAGGRTLVYATDTEDPFSGRPNPVIGLAEDADVLIHDAQYLNGDYKKGWGHATMETAVEVALTAKARKLVLYHHDPDRSDDALDKMGADAQRLARSKGATLQVMVAYEGMEIEV